jgi:hypothetical protein
MTKRYREDVDVTTDGAESSTPTDFRWRGRRYRIVAVLGHWREDAGYWSGGRVDVPQRDLWRVEARRLSNGSDQASGGARSESHRARSGARSAGIYELVQEAETWRLDRVWD